MIHSVAESLNLHVAAQQLSAIFEKIKSKKDFEDYGTLDVYGILAYWEKDPAHSFRVEDISTDSGFVDSLIELLISHNASPIHLRDIVEDFVAFF